MIELILPQGTTSTLLSYRNYDFVNSDDEGYAYHLWPFMSVHYWGENPVGTWTMTVTFKSSSSYISVFNVDLALTSMQYTSSCSKYSSGVTKHVLEVAMEMVPMRVMCAKISYCIYAGMCHYLICLYTGDRTAMVYQNRFCSY